MAKKANSSDNSKICAVLSYILIGIIWYFVDEKMKKNSFAKFHAKQGLVLLICSIIYSVALQVISMILLISLIGIVLLPIVMILAYVPLVLMIIGIINAVNNNTKELPIIGKYANKWFKNL